MLFQYSVNWLDSLNDPPAMSHESGVIAASDYAGAAKHLTSFYGNDNISTLKLTEIEPIMTETELSDMFQEVSHDLHG